MIKRVQHIFEQVSDIVFACDLKGHIVYVNRYTSDLLGIPPDQIPNKHLSEFIHDSQKDIVINQLHNHNSTENIEGKYHEIKLKTKSGDEPWIGQRIHLIRNEQNSTSYFLIIGHLISKLKKHESTLRETELKLKTIIESALDAVVVIDQEGRITEWNHQAETMFGWTKNEAIGKRISETIIPAQHVGAHQKGMKNYIKTGHGPVLNQRIEIIAKKRDGTIFPIELTIIPNKIDGAHFYSAFVRDITQQKEREKILRESEQRWQKLVEDQPEAIQITKGGTVIFLNPAGFKLYGAESPEDILGKDLLEITSNKSKELFQNRLNKLRKGETLEPLEIEITTLKGEHKTIEARSTSVFFKGEQMIQTIARDITQKKEDERRREELMLQLKQANENLNEFAHVVSHDLKAPLRAISSLSEWIVEDYQDKLDEEGKESLQLLVQNVARMDQLIDGVLSYSTITKAQELDESMDSKNQILSVIRLVSPPKNIKIDLEGRFPQITFNKFQFRQVIQNLLSNAIKFMDKENGRIIIRVEETGNKWTFSVEDNGPGIPPENDDIFQLFTSYSKSGIDSSGIGLSIIKKIMEDRQEEFGFKNNNNEGVTFYFTISKETEPYEESEIDFTLGG